MGRPRETRVTDPTTGGQKGQKLERFDLIPVFAQRAMAVLYGLGGLKYDDNNWRKGYSWRLSSGALERHLKLWLSGESYDEETGVHHLIQVAWHCFTLFTFERDGLGNDDIPERAQLTGYSAEEAAARREAFAEELEERKRQEAEAS